MSRPIRGWILYDAECPMCRDMVRRVDRTFTSRGFAFAPLQLELKPGQRPTEMRVRTSDGAEFGGAEAVLYLAGFIWWARPLRWIAKLPGAKALLDRIYQGIAARRSCDSGACFLPEIRT
jgi:predicted DCC family thiol-disulfide oxidoreductase YuxK